MSSDYPTFQQALQKYKDLESETANKDKPESEALFSLKGIKTLADVNLATKSLAQLYILQKIEEKQTEIEKLLKEIKDKPSTSSSGAIVPSGTNTYGQYKAPSKRGIKRPYPQ